MVDGIYLVGLSGPPRSGKDTLGGLLARILRNKDVPVEVHALSLPMRLAVYGMLGLDYNLGHYEANKDSTLETEDGGLTTIRQEMISLSEKHVKPRLGKGWWGQALLNRVRLSKGVVIVNDMGFPEEEDVFVDTFGPERCTQFHIYREGHTFEGDSRSYVGEGSPIYNNAWPETEARRMYGRLVNQRGWKL